MKKTVICGALAALGAFVAAPAAFAAATTRCTASTATVSNPGYVSCLRAQPGELGPGGATPLDDLQVVQQEFGSAYRRAGLSTDDAGFGPFSVDPLGTNPFGSGAGILMFDMPMSGPFVLSLQAVDSSDPSNAVTKFVLYNFDFTGMPTDRINFDTRGIDRSLPSLEVAALYVLNGTAPPPVGGVPEPGTWALVLASFAALAVTSRRRAG